MSERSPFALLAALSMIGAAVPRAEINATHREPDPPRLPKPRKPVKVHKHSREIARRLRQQARAEAKAARIAQGKQP